MKVDIRQEALAAMVVFAVLGTLGATLDAAPRPAAKDRKGAREVERRVALVKGGEAAQLTGPGLPTTGCPLGELPAWGAWRLLALAGQTGQWQLRDGTSVAEHTIAQWPAALATGCEAATEAACLLVDGRSRSWYEHGSTTRCS